MKPRNKIEQEVVNLSHKLGEIGKRIETVEVDLREMKVVQCYGACDKFTIYHDRIVNLVNGSMNVIKQYMNNNKQLAV